MSDEYDVNVGTEALKAIEGIVDDAFERMQESSTIIGAQGDNVTTAFSSSGTAVAQGTYADLASVGRALAEELEGLRSDLNLTGEQGHNTDEQVQQAQTSAAGGGAGGGQAGDIQLGMRA